MYFRFGSALALILLIFVGGILLEKNNLKLRREVNAQHDQMEVMRDYHAHLRMRTARLTLVPEVDDSTTLQNRASEKKNKSATEGKSVVPLLHIED